MININLIENDISCLKYHWRAAKCIDGKRTADPSQHDPSMCHSDCCNGQENAPWLALEFSGPVNVTRVDIYNRVDNPTMAARFRNVEVRLTEELPTSDDQMYTGGELLGTFKGPGTVEQKVIKVDGNAPKIGRYVLIQMRHRETLNLYEVEAFGQGL